MKTVTLFFAWLIGTYYEPCPVCGRGIAYLYDGRIVGWCSRAEHKRRGDPSA